MSRASSWPGRNGGELYVSRAMWYLSGHILVLSMHLRDSLVLAGMLDLRWPDPGSVPYKQWNSFLCLRFLNERYIQIYHEYSLMNFSQSKLHPCDKHIHMKKQNIGSTLEVGLCSLLLITPYPLPKTTIILTSNHRFIWPVFVLSMIVIMQCILSRVECLSLHVCLWDTCVCVAAGESFSLPYNSPLCAPTRIHLWVLLLMHVWVSRLLWIVLLWTFYTFGTGISIECIHRSRISELYKMLYSALGDNTSSLWGFWLLPILANTYCCLSLAILVIVLFKNWE